MEKVLDTREYVAALREIVEQGGEAGMTIWGSSMAPFLIHGRDRIFFSAPDRPLCRGDMVFYLRDSGQFVMHRICKVRSEGLYIVGDAQNEIEGPVNPDQVFGLVTKVHRRGKWIGPEDFWWKFYEHIWIRLVGLRPMIFTLYRFLTGNK